MEPADRSVRDFALLNAVPGGTFATQLAGAGMTSISHSAATAEVQAVPHARARNFALDRARTFLTLVVLIHHAVIPYTYFGHTDPKFWIGFDCVVLATDSFFMAMFFFLSGLFVWPSLTHKAPSVFVRDRLLRLGVPFMIAAFTIIPIAYYAFEFRQHPEISFTAFWWKTITVGPWPSGPIWFIWVLLTFDLTASLLYRVSPTLLDPINRLSLRGFERPADVYLFLLAVTAIVYIPARVYFGAGRWFEFGPFDVQASRVLLYASYFLIGAGIGAANFDRGVLSPDGQTGEEQLGLGGRGAGSVLPAVGADRDQARDPRKSGPPAALVRSELRPFLRRFQRRDPVRDPGLLPEVQAGRLEPARPDAGRRLWHVSGALPDHALAAILAVRL